MTGAETVASQTNDGAVPSPCVQVCKLDTGTMTCIGCGRLMTEIRDWTRMSDDDKRAVWGRLEARRAGR